MGLNIDKKKLLELKELTKGVKLLYVEDNERLREKATHFLEQFFDDIYTASNGKEGLEVFRTIHTPIVITDLEMPHMDGFKMTGKIHKIAPQTKVIVTAPNEDSDTLHKALDIGVYRFLKKPLVTDKLLEALLDALHEVKLLTEQKLFDFYVETIFNSQHNLLMLYKEDEPIIVNETFLNFFQVDDIESFNIEFHSIGDTFLEHKNFLYNTEDRNWYEEALENLNKLYHVKLINHEHEFHHFVFRMTKIENQDNYYLVSLDDITDLNLLKLFDEKQSQLDEEETNQSTFINLLQSIQRNHTEIKLFNLYKGLTVTNKGIIVQADENRVALQTTYLQQRCAHHEGKLILSHSLFPADILCQSINSVNYEEQSISVADFKFLTASPTQRSSIRLTPEDDHKVSLFYEGHKFGDYVKILNLSVDAVRLSLLSLPAGFQTDEKVIVDMVFSSAGKQPLIINCEGKILYITEEKHEFHVVIKLAPKPNTQKNLINYLSKRQMALIREFKGLQYGK
ncbi:response regulator transcription factor [Sulfurimonas marina]|uniref:Response regulator n=1 Tax=Sulfurimonas marina TaxID=2590551 RepID=A0A7M1AUR0_9BACT|nr:response regulator [Sulfurimonas marina]QOP41164.1 response regulator [Sulfurimonas marina]